MENPGGGKLTQRRRHQQSPTGATSTQRRAHCARLSPLSLPRRGYCEDPASVAAPPRSGPAVRARAPAAPAAPRRRRAVGSCASRPASIAPSCRPPRPARPGARPRSPPPPCQRASSGGAPAARPCRGCVDLAPAAGRRAVRGVDAALPGRASAPPGPPRGASPGSKPFRSMERVHRRPKSTWAMQVATCTRLPILRPIFK